MTPNTMHTQLTGFILEEQTELTLAQVCRACAVQAKLIIELVDEGVIAASGKAPDQWHFTGVHMQRARVALRLQKDLGVNLAGAALALQLLDELETLRAKLQVLEAGER